ncbi:RmlC-like cupins superfamily protein [Striga hermonthica]|uniref:RmlC-like cupins superfamily protein n=1 Tax=Striga hermonthica TaxID=68872 RepID=A0A9N7NQ48_STRHE|nr:RmlC-like cupins superfamily protein [Striga hermonthica]
MATKNWSLLLLLVLNVCCLSKIFALGLEDDWLHWSEEEEAANSWDSRHHEEKARKWPFLLEDSKHVVKTDAGEMRLVRGYASKFAKSPIHIGFIRMEPRSLFIPQYLDSSLILFIHCGEAKIGHINKGELVERKLKKGDIYRIEAGSAFYLINREKGRILHIICSIDTSESLGWHTIQSFFVAGGTYPASVLSGFDHATLSDAFNVSEAELGKMFTRQNNGPIIYLSSSGHPSVWSEFLEMKQHHKLAHMKRKEKGRKVGMKWIKRPICNIFDKEPDFKNDYGWSTTLDESDYSPLEHGDVGVYLVNLNAGSMMAPHMNPRATEYGIVLRGSGVIQIVYPNGSLAMKARVEEGNVFWIPRYFPFCQIASKGGSFEFFGFTTSARDNKPQFLVGGNSLLHAMRGPEFEAAFDMSKDGLKEIINAQRESVILPTFQEYRQ